ncbi:hypothetical protein M758_1G201700 [Ceratodon purpureus]|nr:hypothetical protein M758_1G201700 [Ceratodon purpureus]
MYRLTNCKSLSSHGPTPHSTHDGFSTTHSPHSILQSPPGCLRTDVNPVAVTLNPTFTISMKFVQHRTPTQLQLTATFTFFDATSPATTVSQNIPSPLPTSFQVPKQTNSLF